MAATVILFPLWAVTTLQNILLRDSTEISLDHQPTHDDYWRPIPYLINKPYEKTFILYFGLLWIHVNGATGKVTSGESSLL